LPVKKDLADVVGTVRWLLGCAKKNRRLDGFGYAEKMDTGVIWGTTIWASPV